MGLKRRIKWNENNSVSVFHVFSSFLSSMTSVSFNLSPFLISFPLHLILSPFIFPFSRVSIAASPPIIFLIFPPSSVSFLFRHSRAFSPPALLLCFGLYSLLPRLFCYARHPLPMLYSSATLTQCFIYLPFYLPLFHSASLLADVLGLFTYSLSLLPWRYTNPPLSLVAV